MRISLLVIIGVFFAMACTNNESDSSYTATLMTADPGHFHAALVQKVMYPEVNPQVYVYAPESPDVYDHLKRIEGFNSRESDPTSWQTKLYTGDDFFDRMISEKPGNVLVLAGNNKKKTEYILEAVRNGINVYSDKPMAINRDDFELLKEAYNLAGENGVLLYDIMTERFEITSILQKALTQIPVIFGEMQTGTAGHPAVVKESIHHFFKYVAGNKIKRPPWFFDVEQEGDGIVDVTTHLVDLIQWACYPEVTLDYMSDIKMIRASRWPTAMTLKEFSEVTQTDAFPDYLAKDVDDKGVLQVYSNGEMVYRLKDVYAKVKVEWRYRAPEGAGDTHYSIIRGTLADLEIRQGENENYKPELYILPHKLSAEYQSTMENAIAVLAEKYPGIRIESSGERFRLVIPDKYRVGHEAHFGQVTQRFLEYLKAGKLPDWEVPNSIAKYYTTIAAFEMAKNQD